MLRAYSATFEEGTGRRGLKGDNSSLPVGLNLLKCQGTKLSMGLKALEKLFYLFYVKTRGNWKRMTRLRFDTENTQNIDNLLPIIHPKMLEGTEVMLPHIPLVKRSLKLAEAISVSPYVQKTGRDGYNLA